LLRQIRQALEPINKQHYLANCLNVRKTITTALELLATIDNSHIQTFIKQFAEKSDELLAHLEWPEQALSPWRECLSGKEESLILWAWQNQKELGVSYEEVLPHEQQDLVMAFWNALSLFHRSSSLAESLHSWIRPYLQVHRGMPDWLFPFLQLVWNHHVFNRGKRKGQSPMAWAGIENVPSLSSLFDWLANSEKPTLAPSQFFPEVKMCYPISANL
jgi:hypothetical protein